MSHSIENLPRKYTAITLVFHLDRYLDFRLLLRCSMTGSILLEMLGTTFHSFTLKYDGLHLAADVAVAAIILGTNFAMFRLKTETSRTFLYLRGAPSTHLNKLRRASASLR